MEKKHYAAMGAGEVGCHLARTLSADGHRVTRIDRLGLVGPSGDYAFFSSGQKIVMIFLMWLGRLEFFAVLAVLHPRFWRR